MPRLLDQSLEDLTLDDLRDALTHAGDEDEHWEAKAQDVRREHVLNAIAGLANRDGGSFVIGAARGDGGIWTLSGARPPAEEPGLWLSQIIRSGLQPIPNFQSRVFNLDNGRYAAVIQVDAHPEHLVLINDGRVVRREHGSTDPVIDGAELTRLVRARSAMDKSTDINVDTSLVPDQLAIAAGRLLDVGGVDRLRTSVTAVKARLINAAEHRPVDELAEEADRLTALTSVLVQAQPDGAVTQFAIAAHLQTFDAATGFHRTPTTRPDLDLYRVLLRNTRALGALLVRLEIWPLIRRLAAHGVPKQSDVYSGWMTFVGVQDARAGMSSPGPEGLRDKIRESVAIVQRIRALHPDGADEHQLLESVLAFDMFTNLIELDVADRKGHEGEVSPDFALFGPDSVRPIVARLSSDTHVRASLLPDRDTSEADQLIASLDKQCRRLANSVPMFWHGLR